MRARSAAVAVSAGVAGEFFEFEDVGVLRGLDPADAGLDGGGVGIPVGGGLGVGGGEQGGAFGAEDPGSEEPADDLVQEEFGAWTVRGWSVWSAACLGGAQPPLGMPPGITLGPGRGAWTHSRAASTARPPPSRRG